jgi:hypothetical protein
MNPKYDKNKKTISLTKTQEGEFPGINVMFLAPAERWAELLNNGDFEQVAFEDIKPFLHGWMLPKDRQALKEYAERQPENFSSEVFACVLTANFNPANPNSATKPRGGSPYGLDKDQMWEIRACSKHLYLYMMVWRQEIKKQPEKLPRKLKQIFDICNIKLPNRIRPAILTLKIIEKTFGFKLMHNADFGVAPYETFYKYYIRWGGGLKRLQGLQSIKAGRTEPLKKIFHTSGILTMTEIEYHK